MWQLGKITGVTTEATPRLFYACLISSTFACGLGRQIEGATHRQNYAYGPDARLDSWIILKRVE